MNKLFTKVAALSVGLAMAIGVGVAIGGQKAPLRTKADTTTGSVTASGGALSGWTGTVGSAYADGSVKFGTQGNNLANTSLFSGDVSTGMTQLAVDIQYKVNGTGAAANAMSITPYVNGSYGTAVVESGFSSTTKTTKTITLSSGLAGCTGFKITYSTKSNGNIGLYSLSWTVTYTAGGGGDTPTPTDLSGETGTINFGTPATKINAASVTGDDDLDQTWTITTVGTSSFTQQPTYSQVGSGSAPATSITFTTTLNDSYTISALSAKFGGFSGTAGTVTLKVGNATVGTGSLNGTSDVVIENSVSNQTSNTLTVVLTGIAKGVKCYYISYTCADSQVDPPTYTGVTVTVGSLNGSYKGSAYIDAEATVTGTNNPSQLVTWYVTATNTYGTTTSTSVASISSTGRITFSDNGTVYVWALAADDTTHNTTGVAATASGLTYQPGSVDLPYTVAEARNAIDTSTGTSGVYVTGIVSEILTEYSSQYHNVTFTFSTDGLLSSAQLEAYRCKDDVSDAYVGDVNIGDTVVVYGNLVKFGATYELSEGCKITTLTKNTTPIVRFNLDVGNILVGETKTYAAATANLGEAVLSYSSSDETKATVTSAGAVTALALGSTTITAEVTIESVRYYDTITINVTTPKTVVQALAFIDLGANLKDNYVEGYVSQVGSLSSGSITYSISDDGETTGDQLQVYKGKGIGGANFVEGDLVIGDHVVVWGNLTLYHTQESDTYQFENGNHLISKVREGVNSITLTPSTVSVMPDASGDVVDLFTSIVIDQTAGSTKTVNDIVWVSGDDDVFLIDDGEYVAGSSTGTTTINATIGGVTYGTATVNVEIPLVTITADLPTSYVRITSTSNLTAGDYLIVYETDSIALDGSLETLDAHGNNHSIVLDTTNHVAKSSASAYKFTIATMEGGYSIQSASGLYIGQTSDANGLKTSDTDPFANAITFDEDGNANIVSGGAYLRFNSASGDSNYRFRYYKSSSYTAQKAVQLYKYSTTSQAFNMSVDSDLLTVVDTYMVNDALTVCDATGQTAPTGWSTMASAFTQALKDKYELAYVRSGTNNNVEKFLQAYDYVVEKYGADYDFLGRISSGIVTPSGRASVFGNASEISFDTTLVIVIASVVAVAAVGGYFFLRRKKEQ